MSVQSFNVLLLPLNISDSDVDPIIKLMPEFGLVPSTLSEEFRAKEKSAKVLLDLTDDAHAVLVLLGSLPGYPPSTEGAVEPARQESWERLVEKIKKRVQTKFIIIKLQKMSVPSFLDGLPEYVFFETATNDIHSAVERLSYFVRDHVEARKSVEQTMPETGFKTSDTPASSETLENSSTTGTEDASFESTIPDPAAEAAVQHATGSVETPSDESDHDQESAGQIDSGLHSSDSEDAPVKHDSDNNKKSDDEIIENKKSTSPAHEQFYDNVRAGLFGLIVIFFFAGFYLDRTVPEISDGVLYEDFGSEFVLIRPQQFLMGSNDNNSDLDERPTHLVDLATPFMIGVHEVTNKLFGEYVTASGQARTVASPFGDAVNENWPVVNVSFDDAVEFTKWFSKEVNADYRLPTESEWEFVAQQSKDMLPDICAIANIRGGTEDYALLPATNSIGRSLGGGYNNCGEESPVLVAVEEMYRPDAVGLYHLFGNAAEWVQDCYSINYLYPSSDGAANESGDCNFRVYRGGSWMSQATTLTPTYRSYAPPEYRDLHIGFRLVRDLNWLDLIAINRQGTDWNRVLRTGRYVCYGSVTLFFLIFFWTMWRQRRLTGMNVIANEKTSLNNADSEQPMKAAHRVVSKLQSIFERGGKTESLDPVDIGSAPTRPKEYYEEVYGIKGEVFELLITVDSPLVGMSIDDVERLNGVPHILAMRIVDKPRLAPPSDEMVWVGTVLGVMGTREVVGRFALDNQCKIHRRMRTFSALLRPKKAGISEVVIPPDSSLIGQSIAEAHLRKRFGINVLAINQRGEITTGNLREVVMQVGDLLVLHSAWRDLAVMQKNRDLVSTNGESESEAILPE